jgi:DNA-binding NtrC family response regulator
MDETVADDIAEISAVKRVLVRAGHQAVLATSAADAAAAVSKEPPQAAIISSTCEGGGGLELARRFAGDGATADVPLLLLGESGQAPPRAVQLSRPIDPGQLADELKRALEAAWRAQKPAPTPAGRIQLTAIGPGSTAAGPQQGPAAERTAAADALRQRAEELRRAGGARAWATGPPATPPRGAGAPGGARQYGRRFAAGCRRDDEPA